MSDHKSVTYIIQTKYLCFTLSWNSLSWNVKDSLLLRSMLSLTLKVFLGVTRMRQGGGKAIPFLNFPLHMSSLFVCVYHSVDSTFIANVVPKNTFGRLICQTDRRILILDLAYSLSTIFA